VLNNWRRHGEHRTREYHSVRFDPFATGPRFPGWTQGPGTPPRLVDRSVVNTDVLHVSAPRTWLLSTGWRRHGTISCWSNPLAPHRPRAPS
jgi:hypothetical protein